MHRLIVVFVLAIAACAPTATTSTSDSSTSATMTTSTPSSNSGVAPPTPTDVTIHIRAAQNGQTVQVPVNTRFAVELVGVPTAGYQWVLAATMPAFLTRVGEEVTGNTTAAQSQPGFTGGNHWEVYVFAATTAGSGELVMEQRRPWEHGGAASDTFRVTIQAMDRQ